MRISDWISDVCSSDLQPGQRTVSEGQNCRGIADDVPDRPDVVGSDAWRCNAGRRHGTGRTFQTAIRFSNRLRTEHPCRTAITALHRRTADLDLLTSYQGNT